ncbi:hypothetical protein DL96DRAFT_1422369, partial [Flagelloscypha sp. PMI_526]
PQNINIVKEKEAVRILGAWYGNEVEHTFAWNPVLTKINYTLERWQYANPTLEGRRLIVQFVVGGMTQYMTKVQGMPREVEKALIKKIDCFIWADKNWVPVAHQYLVAPKERGGL